MASSYDRELTGLLAHFGFHVEDVYAACHQVAAFAQEVPPFVAVGVVPDAFTLGRGFAMVQGPDQLAVKIEDPDRALIVQVYEPDPAKHGRLLPFVENNIGLVTTFTFRAAAVELKLHGWPWTTTRPQTEGDR